MDNNFRLITSFIADLNVFPLKSLSNLAIYSRENDDSIFAYTFCADGTSHILNYLVRSQKLQDLHYVTVYLDNLNLLLTKEIMSMHKTKVKDFLNDIDPKKSFKEIFTVSHFKYRVFRHVHFDGKKFQFLSTRFSC